MFSQRDLVAFVLHPACFLILILTALALAAALSAANAGNPAVAGPNAKFSVEGGIYFGANPATTRIGGHRTETRKAPRRYSTHGMMANADNCIPPGETCDPEGPGDQCCPKSDGHQQVCITIGLPGDGDSFCASPLFSPQQTQEMKKHQKPR